MFGDSALRWIQMLDMWSYLFPRFTASPHLKCVHNCAYCRQLCCPCLFQLSLQPLLCGSPASYNLSQVKVGSVGLCSTHTWEYTAFVWTLFPISVCECTSPPALHGVGCYNVSDPIYTFKSYSNPSARYLKLHNISLIHIRCPLPHDAYATSHLNFIRALGSFFVLWSILYSETE